MNYWEGNVEEELVISDCLSPKQQFIVVLVVKEERENWGI